jgi:hypothetical protein
MEGCGLNQPSQLQNKIYEKKRQRRKVLSYSRKVLGFKEDGMLPEHVNKTRSIAKRSCMGTVRQVPEVTADGLVTERAARAKRAYCTCVVTSAGLQGCRYQDPTPVSQR